MRIFKSALTILAASFSIQSFAAYEQWQYWATVEPGVKFLSESEAADNMRSKGGRRQYLTIKGRIVGMSRDVTTREWLPPDEPPFYTDDWFYDGAYASEGEAVAALRAAADAAAAPCSVIQWDISDWDTETDFLGLPTRQWKTITTNSEVSVYDDGVWTCIPPNTPASTIPYRRDRQAACLPYYTPDSAVGMCTLEYADTTNSKPITTCGEEVGNPCDTANGAKVVREIDYSGPGITLTREMNTQTGASAWQHPWGSYLVLSGSTALGYATSSGSQEPFRNYGGGKFVSYTGSGIEVRQVGSDWFVYFPSGRPGEV